MKYNPENYCNNHNHQIIHQEQRVIEKASEGGKKESSN